MKNCEEKTVIWVVKCQLAKKYKTVDAMVASFIFSLIPLFVHLDFNLDKENLVVVALI